MQYDIFSIYYSYNNSLPFLFAYDEEATIFKVMKAINNNSSIKFRFPTELEWEYVARGNDQFIFSGSDNPDDVAFYNKSNMRMPMPVGMKKPNSFGFARRGI